MRHVTMYEANSELAEAIDLISSGFFSRGDRALFEPVVRSLLDHDQYMLLADYASYIETQEAVDVAYRDVDRWTRMSILNAARCGFFSSDRSMRQYVDDIWQADAVPVPRIER